MAVGKEEIEKRLGYHKATPETMEMHKKVRAAIVELAELLDELLPDGREKALVMTHLQETAMWANAAIACNLAPLTLAE